MRRKWVSHRERMPQKANRKEEKDDGNGWGTGDELEEGGRTRDRTTAASVMVPKLFLGTRTAVVRVPGLFLGTRIAVVRAPRLFLGTIIGVVADDRPRSSRSCPAPLAPLGAPPNSTELLGEP